MRFEVLQRVEAVQNPNLNSNQDDTEIISTTTLGYTIKSKTPQDELSLRLHGALRTSLSGSVDPELDDTGVALRYVHTAPGTRLSSYAAIQRRELSHLQAFDLVDDNSVIGDFDNLNGSGTRTNANLRFNAQFREDRPFGWGVMLGTSSVRYSNLSAGSTLANADSVTAALNGRYNLSSTTQLTSRVSYLQSKEDGSARTHTYGADFGVVFSSPISELRGTLSFAWPDQSADRISLSLGSTRELSKGAQISFDIGSSFADGGSASLIGRFSYEKPLSHGSKIRAKLDRVIQDGADGNAYLRTVGQIGYSIPLGAVTGLNLDARYLEKDTLGANDTLTEYGLSASITRQLTSDWDLQVGASHTFKSATGTADATSNAVFFTLQRAWDRKF